MTDITVSTAASAPRSLDNTHGKIGYQAHIDGLRAVAVMPVVLYHAGFSAFSGGFVGVDVFFVISGFLITSLIASDLEAGKFSLLNFYERRIRRIFPALFAVIAASAIVAWFIFMPVEFGHFARSVIGAALFGSNILFWQESDYFDAAAQLKPLLHTWSLAVEEQFYIFFPLILMLLYKVRRFQLRTILLALAIVSFGLNLWATFDEPEFAFFMSPPRFWELLLGALLAVGAVPQSTSRLVNQALAPAGLALIAVAVLTFSEGMNFPGFAALVPCLGAALVLMGGRQDGPVVRILSARPVVFLGLISYSLYLWHWPIIVFVRYYIGQDLSAAQALLIIAASLVIAALSWRWIEQPFRRKNTISRPFLFRSAATAMAGAAAVGFAINASDGVPGRLPPEVAQIYSAKNDLAPANRNCVEGDQKYLNDIKELSECAWSLGKPSDGPARYLLWGDSHAGALAPGLEEAGARFGQSGIIAYHGGCPPLLDFETGQSKREKIENCHRFNRAVIDLLKDRNISLVFLTARWPRHAHRDDLRSEGVFFDPSEPLIVDDYSEPMRIALDATLAELSRNNIRAVLVMDVPEVGYDVPHALAKAALTHSNGDIAPSVEFVQKRQALARSVLFAVGKKYNVTVVDPLPEFCGKDRCWVVKDGEILYHDEDHLTLTGAKSISHLFDVIFADRTASK